MKKFVALALAALVSVGAISATVDTAAAKPWGYYKPFPIYKPYPKFKFYKKPGITLYLGAPFAFGFGYAPIYRPYRQISSPHVAWCYRHYPNTYNPANNMYFVKKGVPAVCISPFSY